MMSQSISLSDLHQSIGTAAAPVLIDVRKTPAFESDDRLIVGAIRRPPEDIGAWHAALPAGRKVVVYCVHGHEVSQGVTGALREAGLDARYLDGGIADWVAHGLATRRRLGMNPGKWITRERPKIDRIACPWLVRRFIDPEAAFVYVPAAEVQATASRIGATPYDVSGAEFGHHGDQCSFDAFVRLYGIVDPALARLADIVRGADTGHAELTPQSPGLLALSSGLSLTFADDLAMLDQGMIMYDALFAWCREKTA
jgi:rhodanese-related sulfurtransferase